MFLPLFLFFVSYVPRYCPADQFARLLASANLTLVEARDLRYAAVLHLETAAKGAEAFYTTSNNRARKETPEQAREADDKVQHRRACHKE